MGEMKWVDAWEQLVYQHSPFRAVDNRDFEDLQSELSGLEKLFLTTPALQSYCDEWRKAGDSSAATESANDRETIHAAAMQLQLMENVFFSLRLDRHANAPDNRGWMNLFRQWAGSPTFRRHVRELQATFSLQFVEFYYHYIENWPIDEHIPHAWDVDSAARKEKAEDYDGVAARAVRLCLRKAPTGRRGRGIFLDPGRVEAGPARGVDEPMRVREEQHGTAPASGAPAADAPSPAADSSSSTD